MKHASFVLLILDGWGIAPPGPGNAVTLARLQTYPELWKKYPHALLRASGSAVGLPARQNGNSEAGHMNIGAGRVVEQDAVRINHCIDDGTFFRNPALLHALHHVKKRGSDLHLMGVLTAEQSGHAYPKHLYALLQLAREQGNPQTYIHLFTDGRDTPKFAALELVAKLRKHLGTKQQIATVMGRLYLDRAKRWYRTEEAYNALVLGRGRPAKTAEEAIMAAYKRGESDEFISPTIIGATSPVRRDSRVRNADSIVLFHLRSDRARQITKAFMQEDFEKKNPGTFRRQRVLEKLHFVALTDFGPDLPRVVTAFPSSPILETLPMALPRGRQMYIAESEKFSHMTFFLNGGYAAPVNKEQRVMVSSSNVVSFDQRPQMEARSITARVLHAFRSGRYDFVAANLANADMVGHTGNIRAGIAAARVLDECLQKISSAVLAGNGTLLVTGDHGNIEGMLDKKTGAANTEHSAHPVPFMVVSRQHPHLQLKPRGILADIAPTILALMKRKKPKAMTGHSLLRT